MTEHPLNCDDRTALAIYEGRQTQDRRPLTKRRVDCDSAAFDSLDFSVARLDGGGAYLHAYRVEDDTWHRVFSRIKVGDVVWIREAHRCMPDPYRRVIYRADFPNVTRMLQRDWQKSGLKWHASIHMPRKFCRSLRRVTRVWFERTQDISEADAIAEGIGQDILGWYGYGDSFAAGEHETARQAFRCMYESLYPGACDENGWVVCKEFEPIEEA